MGSNHGLYNVILRPCPGQVDERYYTCPKGPQSIGWSVLSYQPES